MTVGDTPTQAKSPKKAIPYYFVRWRWWSEVDLEKVAEDFAKEFTVKKISLPKDDMELVLHKVREELKVTADSLTARLSGFKAGLFQKEAAPFTERDVKLRKEVLRLYPYNRSTPIPLPLYVREPKFEVEKKL
jgi:hypothetical protein